MSKPDLNFEVVDDIPNEKSKYSAVFGAIEKMEFRKVLRVGPFDTRYQAKPMQIAFHKSNKKFNGYAVITRTVMFPNGEYYLFIKKVPKEQSPA